MSVIEEDADLEAMLFEKEEELKKFDLDFRPHSYWGPRNLTAHLLSSIKGEERRKFVKSFIDKYGEENLPNISLTKDKLTDNERNLIGRLHPHYMGGEYLPDTNDDEVEIARLTMLSVTQDVISFRAKKRKDKIIYSIVDEYETEFEHSIKTRKKPLSFKELLKFIDEAWGSGYSDYPSVFGGARQFNYEESGDDPEEHWNFETIDSSYYNQLYEWYNIQNWIWLIKEKIKIIEQDEYKNDEPNIIKDQEKQKEELKDYFPHAEKAIFKSVSAGGLASALHRGTRKLAIAQFTKKYFEKYGKLPVGKFKIKETIIFYGLGTEPKEISVDVEFPA